MITPLGLLQWVSSVVGCLVILRVSWDILRNPFEALDLKDTSGRPDHGKVIGLATFVALYALAWGFLGIQKDLHWAIWSLLAVLPYGLLGLRVWFKSRAGETERLSAQLERAELRKDGLSDV